MDTFEQEAVTNLPAIRAFAYHLTGNADDAADLVQDTFYKAQRYWHTYENGTNCRGWLFSVCRNQFKRSWSRRKRREEVLDSGVLRRRSGSSAESTFHSTPPPGPEASALAAALEDHLNAALMELPVCFRAPLRLRILEGLQYGEIAAELDLPLGTVKSRVSRGRRRLQEKLRELGYGAGARYGSMVH